MVVFTLHLGADDVPGPQISFDVNQNQHPIAPYIFGIADPKPDPDLAKEVHWPLNRWGGDAATRYNWQIDMSNSGGDWFFMVQGGGNGPSGGPDAMISAAKGYGGRALITIPFIDYIDSAKTTDCSFPVSIFGPQEKVNPFVHPVVNGQTTDAGNGKKPDGTVIQPTKDQIERIHIANSPDIQKAWVQHLTNKFGQTKDGGVAIYELDNEPDGWANSHRDVHPDNLGHDELVNKTLDYAKAIKAADDSALVAGPGGFLLHYDNDGRPGDGAKEHGGLGQAEYYLQKMADAEKDNGTRLLDYFDEHYYPLDQRNQNDDTILERTRSLWDPTYKEQDWYGDNAGAIQLIPKFKSWIAHYYPGTKISFSEYGWGDAGNYMTALAMVDVLGIFAREQVDMACYFGSPHSDQPLATTYRLFLNYDGQGGKFGDTWIDSKSTDQGKLAAYGALRTSDKALTLVFVNKTHDSLKSQISLSGYMGGSSAKVYLFSQANLKALRPQPDAEIKPEGFEATFPPQSATLYVLPGL